jgi:hypothetical protein
MAGLEFHQHVDVTVGTEIVQKDGAKQRQSRNVDVVGRTPTPRRDRSRRVGSWLHDTAGKPR